MAANSTAWLSPLTASASPSLEVAEVTTSMRTYPPLTRWAWVDTTRTSISDPFGEHETKVRIRKKIEVWRMGLLPFECAERVPRC
jgi:hypothetical protein